MIRYIWLLFLIITPSFGSLEIYGENLFDPDNSEKIHHLHSVGILCRSSECYQEPVYRLPNMLEKCSKELCIKTNELPGRITFYVEYYYKGSDGEELHKHTLLERVLDIKNVEKKWHYGLYDKFYSKEAQDYRLRLVKEWTHTSEPRVINMHIINSPSSEDGISILVDTGDLIEFPDEED